MTRWYVALWGPSDSRIVCRASSPGSVRRDEAVRKLEFEAEDRVELDSMVAPFLGLAEQDPDYYIVIRRATPHENGRRAQPLSDVATIRRVTG